VREILLCPCGWDGALPATRDVCGSAPLSQPPSEAPDSKMSLKKRIYIFFRDASPEAARAEESIREHASGDRITVMAIDTPGRNRQALEKLLQSSLSPEKGADGELKACFLVKEEKIALYPCADVDTVLLLASRD